ncbi:MAG: zinc-ribbon domain-containing protein [Promethearchaeota archaeon]|nr:MAG: zinc-ribbon domain-containing protein [Candidatus Lokiarchaeota archaeon]
MSNQNLYREFKQFGDKMKTIAILTLIGLIGSILGYFTIIGTLISIVMTIIIIIYFLLIIGPLKRAGRMLDYNQDLLGFPLKFILGTIIRAIGLVFFQIGLALIFIVLFITIGPIEFFAVSLIIFFIGVGLILIGSILRYLAWGGLENFFGSNAQLFPSGIAYESKSGANLCKIGCIIDMFIFIPFIGDILRIFGYFKLASLENLTGAPAQSASQSSQPVSAPAGTQSLTQSLNYCPNCGADVSTGARFCPSCGAEID